MEKVFVASEEQTLWIAEMAISRARYEAWLRREIRMAAGPCGAERVHVETVGERSRRLVRRASELVAVSKALCLATERDGGCDPYR